ncbi:uncharacterized protein LOC135165162 [Diachasmimorpha longicaudata]|uniref:uncharacterized protein LOC135165162 n=1 Tax=Diachasmimorpha longicaudata TaxID=58733 RepID=UPI0030B8BC1A
MEFFGKLMRLLGVGKPDMDPTVNLPPEVVQSIFRLLDPESLLNAARVSRGWHRVCQSDPRLRATARRHIRREQIMIFDLIFQVRKPETVVKHSQIRRASARPVVFNYGPSGVSRGVNNIVPQNGKNIVKPREKPEFRSMLKFR